MYKNAFTNSHFHLTAITNVEQVKQFADYLVNTLDVNLHPDTPFEDYVEYETGEPTFSFNDISIGNRLMDECFDVCSEKVYEIMCNVLFKRLGIITEEQN